MYGVLGLDPLIDAEGSSAFYAGKDLEKETSGYGIRFLLPDLYSKYGKRKDEFEKKMQEKEKEIDGNDRYLKKMEPIWEE